MKAYIIVLIVDGHSDTNMYWNYIDFNSKIARIYYHEFKARENLELAKKYLIKNNAEDMQLKLVEITI